MVSLRNENKRKRSSDVDSSETGSLCENYSPEVHNDGRRSPRVSKERDENLAEDSHLMDARPPFARASSSGVNSKEPSQEDARVSREGNSAEDARVSRAAPPRVSADGRDADSRELLVFSSSDADESMEMNVGVSDSDGVGGKEEDDVPIGKMILRAKEKKRKKGLNLRPKPKGLGVDMKMLGGEEEIGGGMYKEGDMVWAKVKSHPWWPGQVYNPALASATARRSRKPGHMLIAFFGDSSYGWFMESDLVPFGSNFEHKSKQSGSRTFLKAVEEAVDEVGRRALLGLSCPCKTSELFKPMQRKGYVSVAIEGYAVPGVYSETQIEEARRAFNPAMMLLFVRRLAAAPLSRDDQSVSGIMSVSEALAYRAVVSVGANDRGYLNFMTKVEKALQDPGIGWEEEEEPQEPEYAAQVGCRDHIVEISSEDEKSGGMLQTVGRLLIEDMDSKDGGLESDISPDKKIAHHFKMKDLARKPNLAGKSNVQKDKPFSGGIPTDGLALTLDVSNNGLDEESYSRVSKTLGIEEDEEHAKECSVGDKRRAKMTCRKSVMDGSELANVFKLDHLNELPSSTLKLPAHDDLADATQVSDSIGPLRDMGCSSNLGFQCIDKSLEVDRENFELDSLYTKPTNAINLALSGESSLIHSAQQESAATSLASETLLKVSNSEEVCACNSEESGGMGRIVEALTIKRVNEVVVAPNSSTAFPSPSGQPRKKPYDAGVKKSKGFKKVREFIRKSDGEALVEKHLHVGENHANDPEFSHDIDPPQKRIRFNHGDESIINIPEVSHMSELSYKKERCSSSKLESGTRGLNQAVRGVLAHTVPDDDSTGSPVSNYLKDLKSLALDPFHGIENGCPTKVSMFILKFRSCTYKKSLNVSASVERLKNDHSLNNRLEWQEGDRQAGGRGSSQLSDNQDKEINGSSQSVNLNKQPSVVSKSKCEPQIETKIESRSELKSESKSEVKIESKTEAKTAMDRYLEETEIRKHTLDEEYKPPKSLKRLKKFKELDQKKLKETDHKSSAKSDLKPGSSKNSGISKLQATQVIRDATKSRKPALERRSSLVSDGTEDPMGLLMKFPQGFALPSEVQLRVKFARFESFDVSGTRIYCSTNSALVVFKRSSDAEAAYKYASDGGLFGKADVKFRLKQLSQAKKENMLQSKSDLSKFTREGSEDISVPSMTQEEIAYSRIGDVPESTPRVGGSGGPPVQLKSILKRPDEPGSGKSILKRPDAGNSSARESAPRVTFQLDNEVNVLSTCQTVADERLQLVNMPIPLATSFPSDSNLIAPATEKNGMESQHPDFSNQVLLLLQNCSDVMGNIASTFGDVPYYSF